MTDRYARQNKYTTLSGVAMGNTLANSQQQLSDENTRLMMSKQQVQETNAKSMALMMDHQSTAAAAAAAALQPQKSNPRNALGDISNKSTQQQAIQMAKQQLVHLQKQQAVSASQESTNKSVVMEEEVELEEEEELLDEGESDDDDVGELQCVEEDEDEELVSEELIDEEEAVEVESDTEEHEESILDIDEFDSDNTQLVSEYVKDIYAYLSQVEKQYRVSANFLDRKIVTTKMRAVLIDWLIQVHLKFHLLQETLYLCVQIIDAYLQVQDVPKMHLQLVGVTAMFVASKYEEMYVPAIDDFVYMTDNTYTKAEIRHMEISILKTLNFMFCKPLPLHFLRRFSKAGQADPKQHTLAKYFMELSLHDAEFSSLDPSFLAASSLCLSFRLLNGPSWTRQLEHYSTYKQESLYQGMQKIAKLVLLSSEFSYKYRAVTNKYSASKMMRISQLPELQSTFVRELAMGQISKK
jgi:hypothetical protein